MGDRTRLPKWAQQELARLESDVASWKRKAAAGPENSDTFVLHFEGNDRPLGEGETIRFVLGGSLGYVDIRNEGTELSVRGDGHFSVASLPRAANSLILRPVEHH